MSVAQMFGPALGGILYELGGFYMPFVVFGVLHLVTLLPLLCVLPTSPGQSLVEHLRSDPYRQSHLV